MSLTRAIACGAILALTACASTPGPAGTWVRLGERTVTDRLEGDRIMVGAARGEFREIKLLVHRAPVDFYEVVVLYANGDRQQVSIRRTIDPGDETRAIDLQGRYRTIRAVEFLYDANTMRGRTATVRLLGRR